MSFDVLCKFVPDSIPPGSSENPPANNIHKMIRAMNYITEDGLSWNGFLDRYLQQAFDEAPAGTELFLPAGLYRLNRPLRITNQLVIRGEGTNNGPGRFTCLEFWGDQPCDAALVLTPSNSRIINITLRAHEPAQARIGIWLKDGGDQGVFDEVYVRGFNQPPTADGGGGIGICCGYPPDMDGIEGALVRATFRRVGCEGNYRGLVVNGTGNITSLSFQECYLRVNDDTGAWIRGLLGSRFQSCHFESNDGPGLVVLAGKNQFGRLQSTVSLTFANCWVEQNCRTHDNQQILLDGDPYPQPVPIANHQPSGVIFDSLFCQRTRSPIPRQVYVNYANNCKFLYPRFNEESDIKLHNHTACQVIEPIYAGG